MAEAVRADVSILEEVEILVALTVKKFGRIDILVNNAGICPFCDFLSMPVDVWQRVQDVNHKGVFTCSQLVARQMVTQGTGGRIITISSVGAYTGGGLQAHYNASKAAATSLMRSMAVALGRHGITCNSILPGCIETDLNVSQLADVSVRSDIIARTPLGRLGKPDDIVGAVVFFASDEASFCTGAELKVDGGISINL
jgi:L-rhamnose 1-dehydrogenase